MTLIFNRPYNIKKMKDCKLCEKGVYIWLLKKDSKLALPIDYTDQFLITIEAKQYYILYIGIAPEKEDISSTLISRLIGCHINGNIYGSTFRYSLSSLLDLQFFKKKKIGKNGKPKTAYSLSKPDESKLNDFLNEHCEVCIVEFERPWTIEQEAIQQYSPPLNIEHNKQGWYYSNIRNFRKHSRRKSFIIQGNN